MARPLEELKELIAEFPGIGPRQARRIAQFMLGASAAYREKLARLVIEAAKAVSQCDLCLRYADTRNGLCSICVDNTRDRDSLMVVEKDIDIESIESSSAYHGLYFVLGGLKTLTDRPNGRIVREKELLGRIAKEKIEEVIFALSTTPEGDYTARELSKEITNAKSNIKTTLLGRGLSVGAEIEYADSETLRNALRNRA